MGIASGYDGALWITDSGCNCIERMMTNGVIANSWDIPVNDVYPTGIVAGPDRSRWFVSEVPSLWRITASGTFSAFQTPSDSAGTQIAYADGAIWMANLGSGIARFSESAGFTFFGIRNWHDVSGLTIAKGKLWCTIDERHALGGKIGLLQI